MPGPQIIIGLISAWEKKKTLFWVWTPHLPLEASYISFMLPPVDVTVRYVTDTEMSGIQVLARGRWTGLGDVRVILFFGRKKGGS